VLDQMTDSLGYRPPERLEFLTRLRHILGHVEHAIATSSVVVTALPLCWMSNTFSLMYRDND